MSGKGRAVDKTSADIDRSSLGSVVYIFRCQLSDVRDWDGIDTSSKSGHGLERTEIRPAALYSGYSSRYQKVAHGISYHGFFLLKVE